MNVARVLVVEDIEEWRDRLTRYVKLAVPNCEVTTAATFPLAHELLNTQRWQLLVTDVGLPPDDGDVLGKLLVGQAKKLNVPCIVVSGTTKVTKEDVRDILVDYGARTFFTKDEFKQKNLDFQKAVVACVGGGTVTQPLARLAITIGIKAGVIVLTSPGLNQQTIPSGELNNVFLMFATSVEDGFAGKVIKHEILNEVVREAPESAASQALRNVVKRLNTILCEWVGEVGPTRWIVKGQSDNGYCFNTNGVDWKLDPDVLRKLRSGGTLYDVLVDPQKMARNTPNKDQRMPAKPTRPKDSVDDGQLLSE